MNTTAWWLHDKAERVLGVMRYRSSFDFRHYKGAQRSVLPDRWEESQFDSDSK